MSQPRATRRRILAYALGFPGAYEDHPWGEDVAKVGGKIFVFLGMEDSPEPGMTVRRYEGGRVRLEPFEPIPRANRRELEDEAKRLAAFHAD